MKNTGITRKVDDMGRIVLPMELRRNMGIVDGTPLEISVEGGNIVLSPEARSLTPEELEQREWRPVWAKNKTGEMVSLWVIVGQVYANSVLVACGLGEAVYSFTDFDFYDREVPHR